MSKLTLLNAAPIAAGATTLSEVFTDLGDTESLEVEAIFVYGAGGTAVKVYLQTSLDGGTTWFDIASLAFATATASKVSAINERIAPAAQAFTPSDGTLTDNTIVQGVIGDRIRTKTISTGTYTGTTTLTVVVNAE